MAPDIRKKRRLFAGLLLASCCQRTACSDQRLPTAAAASTAVDGSSLLDHDAGSSSLRDGEEVDGHATNRRSMETAASSIRSSMIDRKEDANDNLRRGSAFSFEEGSRPKTTTRHHRQRRQRAGRRKSSSSDNDNIGAERDLIVGGSAAPPGRFPYLVSLQLEEVLDDAASGGSSLNGEGAEVRDVHTCGGTLIAMDVVLTAGHCGYEELPSAHFAGGDANGDNNNSGGGAGNDNEEEPRVNFGAVPQQIFYGADVGAYDLDTNDGGGYTVENMLFEKLVLHPDYTGFHGFGNSQMSLRHDVMLVKLYGSSDQPVAGLHDPAILNLAAGEEEEGLRRRHREPEAGEELVVVGWGDTDPASGGEATSLASTLHAATVNYVPNDVCEASKGYSSIQSSPTGNNNFEDYFEYDGTISDDMMCALGEERQDACQGDSGGGLIRLGEDFNGDDDVQMGIVSWGLQCGDEDFPGVYSRVGDHYDWIAQQVCELSDSPPSSFQCPTKPYPPGSPFDPVVDLTVTIRFDDYRSETAWVLESIPDFRNIVFRQFGTYKPKETVDENNAMSETVPVHSGRFYMLSILDEFGDGFCCTVGEGYFRVDSASSEYPVVETTPGILWSPHALRRAFYVSSPPPDDACDDCNPTPPNYVTISVTLGMGADPGQFLLVALENAKYEALMLYEIRPFVIMNDSRNGSGTGGGANMVYSRVFQVPVFGAEFERQRYNVMIYDDNEGAAAKASFEVYLGDAHPDNLVLAQSGNYGDENHISRSFVLFKKKEEGPINPPVSENPEGYVEVTGASMVLSRSIIPTLMCLILVALLGH